MECFRLYFISEAIEYITIELLTEIISQFELLSYQYSDERQLYLSKPSDPSKTTDTMMPGSYHGLVDQLKVNPDTKHDSVQS